jgi:CheY-like chemotaxis protein
MDRTGLQTLLYVDDEPDIRQIVQMALGLAPGLDIHTGDSGESALSLARTLRPDLVLLDVMMPGLDGPGTLSRMRSDPTLARIPVVFMTAKAMPQEVARFRELGAAGVIAKPFDPMKLAQQVFAIWDTIPATDAAEAQLRDQVKALGEKFLTRTAGQIVILREYLARLRSGDQEALTGIQELSHKIHGSGAMFGFAELSEAAGEIERLTVAASGNDLADRLGALIEELAVSLALASALTHGG